MHLEESNLRELIEQAYMTGQKDAGVDPSYSEARNYFDKQDVQECIDKVSYNELPIIKIDKDILDICIEAYNNNEKLLAIKTLSEEGKRDIYDFNIRVAKEFLESKIKE